jgi:hypothetical protein
MKFFPAGAEFFHGDGQTDRHDEASSSEKSAKAIKMWKRQENEKSKLKKRDNEKLRARK